MNAWSKEIPSVVNSNIYQLIDKDLRQHPQVVIEAHLKTVLELFADDITERRNLLFQAISAIEQQIEQSSTKAKPKRLMTQGKDQSPERGRLLEHGLERPSKYWLVNVLCRIDPEIAFRIGKSTSAEPASHIAARLGFTNILDIIIGELKNHIKTREHDTSKELYKSLSTKHKD